MPQQFPQIVGELTRSLKCFQLLVQLQDKEQIIASLRTENHNITTALHAAETRVSELYADQSRMEEELAARIEVIDKLRSQVRELEKEKRDTQRRYNEQVRNMIYEPARCVSWRFRLQPSRQSVKRSMTTSSTSSLAYNP